MNRPDARHEVSAMASGFPVRETAFAAETPPAREVLAQSRTMKGGGATGVATLGAAGVEVAQNVLAEAQTATLPLVPYLDTLRGVLITVALGDIVATIYARLDDWKRGAVMITARLAGFAASPWMRAALRYGAIVLAVLLFLLALRRSGQGTAASPNDGGF